MLRVIPNVLDEREIALCRERLSRAPWGDGRATAGHQSAKVKENLQLPQDCAEARELGELVLRALERNPLFVSATLPAQIYPPLFNRYDAGMSFGAHVDNAIRPIPGTGRRVRTDVSATLFLSSPSDYDGGEMIIEDTYGAQGIRLPAGDLVVYPATSRHRIAPITRGSRLAAFFWVQSLVRADEDRALLFDLDRSIVELGSVLPNHPALLRLTAIYHNLIRKTGEL
jgi:PKHD-type hydroxylase